MTGPEFRLNGPDGPNRGNRLYNNIKEEIRHRVTHSMSSMWSFVAMNGSSFHLRPDECMSVYNNGCMKLPNTRWLFAFVNCRDNRLSAVISLLMKGTRAPSNDQCLQEQRKVPPLSFSVNLQLSYVVHVAKIEFVHSAFVVP